MFNLARIGWWFVGLARGDGGKLEQPSCTAAEVWFFRVSGYSLGS